MVIGDIERDLFENCTVTDLQACQKSLDTLIEHLPDQLVGELYLKALWVSVKCVIREKGGK